MLTFNQLRFVLTGFFLIFIIRANSQTPSLVRSTLGAGGASAAISISGEKTVLLQSIGQSSVTGLFRRSGFELRQGYIQPLTGINIMKGAGNWKITVWPNPFSSEVFLKIYDETDEPPVIADFKITDLAGKVVYSGSISLEKSAGIKLSFLRRGIYILNIRKDNRLFYNKIIKE